MLLACSSVPGVPKIKRSIREEAQCTTRIQSKSRRAQIEQPIFRIILLLGLTHTDMTDRLSIPSLGGAQYYIVFPEMELQ